MANSNLETIRSCIECLRSAASTSAYPHQTPDRAAVRKAAHTLAELCKQDEYVDEIVRAGAVEAVVPLLLGAPGTARAGASGLPSTGGGGVSPSTPTTTRSPSPSSLHTQQPAQQQPLDASAQAVQEELEKECCFILGLLAVKPEHQARIAHSGALAGLVRLLRDYNGKPGGFGEGRVASAAGPRGGASGSGGVARRAADAITNLAHENVEIKNLVREQGGIPPLVALLDMLDVKVQRAACGALRTLAFKNEDNKNQIVENGALPMLIQLLRCEDPGVHYEAVGVIGNLVHSSQNVKKRVLEEGALQPVINLLSSDCPDSQREAALLLGQFASVENDTKPKIAQRGAVPALVRMLGAPDVSLKEMAAFALGRLAQNSDNQAGVVQCGGLGPLLELLESKHYNLQHNAAFALYGLAENEDNVPDMVREGSLQRLEDCCEKLQVQASKDCVQKTITRMEQKLQGEKPPSKRALAATVSLLRSSSRLVQQRAAMSLARLAPEDQLMTIFIDKAGMDVLLDMLTDATVTPRMHREAATALLQLTKKLDANSPVDQLPQQPGRTERSVYLGEQYVNNPTLADVTFIVEGRRFHAHRIALLASSEAFRAMFGGGYREKEANSIDIPNISYSVFEAMMRFVYTGQVEVDPAIAFELLQASDQYLLEGLKRLCENAIAQSLDVENVLHTFDMSEAYSAPQLGKRCILFLLEHYDEIVPRVEQAAYLEIMQRMAPCLRQALASQQLLMMRQHSGAAGAGTSPAAPSSGGGSGGAAVPPAAAGAAATVAAAAAGAAAGAGAAMAGLNLL